jgi:undecaprenyl-diphosphatase
MSKSSRSFLRLRWIRLPMEVSRARYRHRLPPVERAGGEVDVIADAPGWVQALVLGVVQGLTEFIPVSSSAHLVLVPALAGWERHGLVFDVALHLGTLLALLVFYRDDLFGMARAVVSRTRTSERDGYRRMVVLLGLASVPVAVAGLTLDSVVERLFAEPISTAWLLLVTAAVLIVGERLSRREHARVQTPVVGPPPPAVDDLADDALPQEPLRLRQALTVGIVQAFALLPGLSRSGLTISSGIAVGMSRPAATRFAFLLGLPAIAGAAIVQLPRIDAVDRVSTLELTVGVSAAALAGYLAIAFLVRLVSRAGIDRFAWYVVPLSVVSLLVLR